MPNSFNILKWYFNSIKVRLERAIARIILLTSIFQFHKGTIRTSVCKGNTLFSEFQFHKGTIRTLIHLFLPITIFWFQFHKGTIRTRSPASACRSIPLFQFHKGTIRTIIGSGSKGNGYVHFNSIKVRLEHLKQIFKKDTPPISIP